MKFGFLILLPIILFSCNQDDLQALKKLDVKVRTCKNLIQFSNFSKSRKEINNIAVCKSKISKCEENELEYFLVLDENKIPVDDFDEFIKKIDALGFRTFYKFQDYSLWVQSGAMGDIRGYLINHNSSIQEVEPFRLNAQYFIEVGKRVQGNIYYFSGN